jgi:uncharacterized protein YraI
MGRNGNVVIEFARGASSVRGNALVDALWRATNGTGRASLQLRNGQLYDTAGRQVATVDARGVFSLRGQALGMISRGALVETAGLTLTMGRVLGRVTTEALNVRSGPGTEYSSTARLGLNLEVKILSVSGDWFEVELGVGSGWVSADFLVPVIQIDEAIGGVLSTQPVVTERSQPPIPLPDGRLKAIEGKLERIYPDEELRSRVAQDLLRRFPEAYQPNGVIGSFKQQNELGSAIARHAAAPIRKPPSQSDSAPIPLPDGRLKAIEMRIERVYSDPDLRRTVAEDLLRRFPEAFQPSGVVGSFKQLNDLDEAISRHAADPIKKPVKLGARKVIGVDDRIRTRDSVVRTALLICVLSLVEYPAANHV